MTKTVQDDKREGAEVQRISRNIACQQPLIAEVGVGLLGFIPNFQVVREGRGGGGLGQKC